MDGSEVGILKEGDQVSLRSFLESHDCRGLETKVRLPTRVRIAQSQEASWTTNLEVLCDFTDETLEGKLADEELRRLLVPTNLTKSDGTRPEAMRLLDTTGRRLKCG